MNKIISASLLPGFVFCDIRNNLDKESLLLPQNMGRVSEGDFFNICSYLIYIVHMYSLLEKLPSPIGDKWSFFRLLNKLESSTIFFLLLLVAT